MLLRHRATTSSPDSQSGLAAVVNVVQEGAYTHVGCPFTKLLCQLANHATSTSSSTSPCNNPLLPFHRVECVIKNMCRARLPNYAAMRSQGRMRASHLITASSARWFLTRDRIGWFPSATSRPQIVEDIQYSQGNSVARLLRQRVIPHRS